MKTKLRLDRQSMDGTERQRLIDFVKSDGRGFVFCGDAAVHMRDNLAWTQWALDELVHEGVLRRLATVELRTLGLDPTSCVYALAKS